MYPAVMANGIRTGDSRGFNKGRSSKFREGSRVRQTPEEGQRTYRPKRCGNNNKDEDNSSKTLLLLSCLSSISSFYAYDKVTKVAKFPTEEDQIKEKVLQEKMCLIWEDFCQFYHNFVFVKLIVKSWWLYFL